MTRLWIRIWNLSQVLEPSPQGVLRVVMRSVLVGMRTGPRTRSDLSLAPRTSSEHTVETQAVIGGNLRRNWSSSRRLTLLQALRVARSQRDADAVDDGLFYDGFVGHVCDVLSLAIGETRKGAWRFKKRSD